MTPFVLALVLAAAVIHATWNLWAKQLDTQARAASLMWIMTAISAVAYAPFALWILAHGSWRPSPAALPWVLGNGVIHVGYFLLLIAGYRAADLSLVYPVARGSGPLLAAAGAVLILGEPVTPMLVAGVLLIALGVLTLTWGPRPGRPGAPAAGLRYGLAVGVTIAMYTLWDGWAVQRVGMPPLVYYWLGEVTRTIVLAPFAWADREGLARVWRGARARIIGIATLSPLAYILILIAMQHGAVSHIAPARELSILIGTWLGGRVLGEGGRRRRLMAAGAFAAGVIALAWT